MIRKLKLFCTAMIFLVSIIPINTHFAQTTEYEMLVSSRNTHSVKRFNGMTGDYIDDFISTGSGGLNTTQDLIQKKDGNILVSGRGNTALLMYNGETGDFIQPFTKGYTLDNPTKITFGPAGNLYVSQWGTAQSSVARFDENGNFIDEFTPNLNQPLGHLWDSEGNLYVACYGSKDVRKFSPDGDALGGFTETGHLQGPTNLWFDGNGSLFVIDWPVGSVLEFNASTGEFIKTLISGMQNSEGYAFGPGGNLYICDWSQNLINRYTPDGTFIDIFTNTGNMEAPNSIFFREAQTSSAGEDMGNVPDNYYLDQNFPNPFNPTTNISFALPSAGEVKLKVFNVRGEKVKILVDGYEELGSHKVTFYSSDLSSGVYFYSLESDDFFSVKKMLRLK